MTRKDYIAIANRLHRARPVQESSSTMIHDKVAWKTRQVAKLEQWTYDRMMLADVLAADNPRFDRQRFYAATEGK